MMVRACRSIRCRQGRPSLTRGECTLRQVILHLSREQLAHWVALLAVGAGRGATLFLTPFDGAGFAAIPSADKEHSDVLLIEEDSPLIEDLRRRFGHYDSFALRTRLLQGEFIEGLCSLVDEAAERAGYRITWS